jgi:hypothetical protein
MSNNTLAVREFSYDEIERSAQAMAKSGYFTDAKTMEQSVVKILAGREMGFGPFASMTGVFIIQGKPTVGANLMASAVKRSGRYNYKIITMTADVCDLEFFEGTQSAGHSIFTAEDARKAGTQNMGKFPRNMLFARAMSNGVRWYCPDVFDGAAVYTPEELGANVNEQGDVIDAVITQPAPAATSATKTAQHAVIDATPTAAVVTPPAAEWPADFLQEMVTLYKAQHKNQIVNALKSSTLHPDSGVELAREWMRVYKENRTNDMTTAEAANAANEHISTMN